MKADVQIVHAGSDLDIKAASRIAGVLRQRGIDVWLDLEALTTGFTPVESVESAIRNCRVCLFIWSESAAKPRFQTESLRIESAAKRFVRDFKRRRPAVIPVRIDETPLPPILANFTRYSWFDLDYARMDERVDELITVIRERLSKRKVFISHSSRDKKSVSKIVNRLKDEDFVDLWYDDFALRPGAIIRREIESGIASADYLIVVLSHNAIDTIDGWIGFELDQAYEIERERNKAGHYFAISVLIESNLNIPGWLATKLHVNLVGNFEKEMLRLVEALKVPPPEVRKSAR